MHSSIYQTPEFMSDARDDLLSEVVIAAPTQPVSDAILTTEELDHILGGDALPF
jgi:hypothetical protein